MSGPIPKRLPWSSRPGSANLRWCPLDATHKAVISAEQCKTLRASGRPAAEAAAIFVEKRIEGYRGYQRLSDQEAAPVHDAFASPR